jgi:predicted enzyme related to lactoylglutathione lyase
LSSTRKEAPVANPVTWFEITGQDADNLQKFYADVFGWKYEQAPGPGKYGMVTAGERGIGGGVGQAQGGSPHVTFYVEVSDPQAALDKIEQSGGKTVMPVTEIPNMVTFALFSDPEGNVVGVFKGQG